MGCGASKDASTADAPAEPPRGGKKASDSGNNLAPSKGQTTNAETHNSKADTHTDHADAPKKRSKLDEADGIGANFDTAAAITVAAGAATLVAGTVSSEARGGLSSAASTAGMGLLAFAKELPWVAPIAFLIAGVVTASAEVHTLKADAQVFCKNVQSCEAILDQVAAKGYLGHVRESVEALQHTLEDGLAFCQRLKTQYFITQLIMSGRDTVKFREISNSMHRQVSVIAAAASIDVQAQIRDDFAQGEKLREKVESLGGFGAVASDPTKMTAAREFLKASDELLLSSVENVRDAVRAEAEKNRAAMEAMERRASERMDALRAQSEAQAKVLQDQVAQLTSMMAAVLGQRTGAAAETAGVTLDFGREDGGLGGGGPAAATPPEPESSAPEPESSHPEPHPETPDPAPSPRPRVATRDEADAVADAVYSGANVRDIMSKMDLYEDEAERRRVVSESALEYEEIGDLVDNDDLHLLTDACAKELGVTDSFIGIIDSKRQTYVSHSKFDVDTGEARAHGDGVYCANVGTVCKHVVKRGDAMQTNGPNHASLTGMPNFTDPEYEAIVNHADHAQGAILGDTFAQFAEYVDENSDKPDDARIETEYDRRGEAHPHGAEKVPTVGGMRSLADTFLGYDHIHYTGVPIKLQGQTVATFCAIDRERERHDVDVEKVKLYAARAQAMLEKRAAEKKLARLGVPAVLPEAAAPTVAAVA